MQVAVARWRRTDTDRFIRQQHVLQIAVGIGVHGDGLDAQFAAGAQDTQGDLAAVSDKNFLDHSITKSGWLYSTGWPFSIRIRLTRPARSHSI